MTDDTATRLSLIEERLKTGGDAFHELRGKLSRLAWYALGVVGAGFAVAYYSGQVVTEIHEARSEVRETSGQLDSIKTYTQAIEGAQRDLANKVGTLTEAVKRLEAPPPPADFSGRRRPR